MDKPRIPFGCAEVGLEIPGQEPPFVLVPRKLYEAVAQSNPEMFVGVRVTYMEPLRG